MSAEKNTGEKTDTVSSGSSDNNNKELYETKEDHAERADLYDVDTSDMTKLSAVFENPLSGVPREKLFADVNEFCQKYDLMDKVELFRKGALISQVGTGHLSLIRPHESPHLVGPMSISWNTSTVLDLHLTAYSEPTWSSSALGTVSRREDRH